MKHLNLITVLALALAGPTAALATTTESNLSTKTNVSATKASSKKGHIVISVSGREGGSNAAYARWHFAQGQSGEGRRRFARD